MPPPNIKIFVLSKITLNFLKSDSRKIWRNLKMPEKDVKKNTVKRTGTRNKTRSYRRKEVVSG